MESSDSLPFDSFKSKKILHSSTPKSSPSDQLTKACTDLSTCSSKTPEKPPNPPSRVRNRRTVASVEEMRDVASELPIPDQDRPYQYEYFVLVAPTKHIGYEILGKFFNSLDSSIRLLRLRRSVSTFTNIFPKVECLTDRRFSYGHLAQLKFILPDVIEIKKVLVHDERTCYCWISLKPILRLLMFMVIFLKLALTWTHYREWFVAWDLSYNTLTGPVPQLLSELPALEIFEFNKQQSHSTNGNPNLCQLDSCEQATKKKKNWSTTIVASLVSSIVFLSAIAILWSLKRRKHKGNVGGRTLKLKN
ncbi:hypothetical protein LOK49_LG12G03002 [Camellia lanceoleosa]|uniref:Uncharacterized protein n=1 Tax=Camellia lanceoleosa TaxID=1840588 RepID=A0ACC0FSL0_9ERIC|nr:hypothetical protein LOK49_LG12G03002 [Camellia lanceoleosa]